MAIQSSKTEGLGRYGEPATLILIALMDGPKHGYAMMSEVECQMGVNIGPGTLYGAIAKLLKLGLIKPFPSSDRARPYEITPEGRQAVAEFIHTWAPIVRIGETRLA